MVYTQSAQKHTQLQAQATERNVLGSGKDEEGFVDTWARLPDVEAQFAAPSMDQQSHAPSRIANQTIYGYINSPTRSFLERTKQADRYTQP